MCKKIFIIFLISSSVFAQDDLYNSLNHSNYEPSYFGMIMGLVVVIGLVYLTGIIYKKMTKIKLDDTTDDKFAINIVSSASLGQNKSLYVVKINNKLSLIAATNEKITHIKELEEDYESQNR